MCPVAPTSIRCYSGTYLPLFGPTNLSLRGGFAEKRRSCAHRSRASCWVEETSVSEPGTKLWKCILDLSFNDENVSKYGVSPRPICTAWRVALFSALVNPATEERGSPKRSALLGRCLACLILW